MKFLEELFLNRRGLVLRKLYLRCGMRNNLFKESVEKWSKKALECGVTDVELKSETESPFQHRSLYIRVKGISTVDDVQEKINTSDLVLCCYFSWAVTGTVYYLVGINTCKRKCNREMRKQIWDSNVEMPALSNSQHNAVVPISRCLRSGFLAVGCFHMTSFPQSWKIYPRLSSLNVALSSSVNIRTNELGNHTNPTPAQLQKVCSISSGPE
ncbi:hypothetical protein GIB67_005411 [Kingdonia uniflora]|uniref:Uncharacterized protein n=1 Tax=Kingdonia uniflora TaxID=39325 RepID=A0A7J7NH40_9MAGN|nr:hypothetical protein GIB67_005411 [Kingdonia uniflora]